MNVTIMMKMIMIIITTIIIIIIITCASIAQSVQRLAASWTVRGLNPGWGEIFRTRPHRLWGPPSLLYNGYQVFPGG